MIKTFFYVIFIAYLCLSFAKKKSKTRKISCEISLNDECGKFDYDFYILSIQYKPGMCYKNDHCNRINNNKDILWTIHGLWPSLYGQSYISNCLNEDLNLEKLSPKILEAIKLFWPSLVKTHTDYIFHNHEWTKHGSCIKSCQYGIKRDNYQSFYFEKTLELRDKFDPAKFLNEKIDSFELEELRQKFQNNLGANVQLICKRDREEGKQYLVEIRLALDQKEFKPITIEKDNFYRARCAYRDNIYLHKEFN